MSRMPKLSLLLTLLMALAACGNKGDLFRPDPADAAADQEQSAAGDESGDDSDDEAS